MQVYSSPAAIIVDGTYIEAVLGVFGFEAEVIHNAVIVHCHF